MADRTDLDALLISALYGELTPADEARLTAHLESHPADRSALADLTRTRAAVRESRILAVQLEPPQSVSELLLQEASRRAPRKPQAAAGWFQRLAHSFMAHPAMAAAAMLLLVVSVAGTVYVRRGADAFAPDHAELTAASAPAQAAPEAAGADGSKTTGSTPDVGAAAGSGAYRVGLDDAPATTTENDPEPRPQTRNEAFGDLDGKQAPPTDKREGLGRLAAPDGKPAKLQTKGGGIELRKTELQPKDLDEEKTDRNVVMRSQRQAGRVASDGGMAKPPGSAGPSSDTEPPPPPPQAAPAPQPAAPAPDRAGANTPPGASAGVKSKAAEKTVPRAGAGKQQAADAVAPPPAPATITSTPAQTDRRLEQAENRLSEETVSDYKTVLGWARKQHDQVIALVKASNCSAAATAALEIYSRAPEYYAANVTTDRSVKPCLAYLNSERQREDRSRAAKRALSDEAAPPPAAKPPAAKPASPVKK